MKIASKLMFGAIILFGILVRIYMGSNHELQKANRAWDEGEVQVAIFHAGRSMSWYFPYNPVPEKAQELLWVISSQAEASGDISMALLALDTMRGAIFDTRQLPRPDASHLAKIDQKIIQLRSLEHMRYFERAGSPRDASEVVAFHTKALAQRYHANPIWSLIGLIFFFGWMLAIYRWASQGEGESAAGNPPKPWTWPFAVALSCCGWLISFWLA